jgi:hypothetical protein
MADRPEIGQCAERRLEHDADEGNNRNADYEQHGQHVVVAYARSTLGYQARETKPRDQ